MKNYRKILIFIMLFAFFARLLVYGALVIKGVSPEGWEYDSIARNLVEGEGFHTMYLGTEYFSCTTPLYPFICAVLYKLFGVNSASIIIFQIILAALLCVIISEIGKRVAGPQAGLIAAALYAVHPGLAVYSATKLHALNIDVFLLALTLLSFMWLNEKVGPGRSLATGLAAGVCILTRSTVMVFIAPAFLWLLSGRLAEKKETRKRLVSALTVTFVIMITVLPWTIRNFLVHREPVFLVTTDAQVFWRGNNENATGTSFAEDGEVLLVKDRRFYEELLSMDELGQRRAFREAGTAFVRQHPLAFLGLFARKLYYFWWFSPSAGILYPSAYLALYKTLYSLYVLLALAGVYCIIKRRINADTADFILLLLFLTSISVFQSFFYIEGRHRWGIEPVFLVLTAIGILGIFSKRLKRSERK